MRDTSRPLAFAAAARGVFDLALEGMIWSRRSLLMAVLLGLPVVFGVLYRLVISAHLPSEVTALGLFGQIVVSYYVGIVLPLAALFYATALIADEVEGKTITYLFTRPIRRGAILSGKFASYLATTLSLSLPPLVVTFFLLATAEGAGVGASLGDLLRDLGVVVLALLSYGALFTLMGVLLRRPMIMGLAFIFVWEWLYRMPGYMPRFTLTAYLRSLLSHRVAEEGLGGLFLQTQPVALSLAVLIGASVVFLAAAGWIFSRREYVLEQ
jgi:ABC-2 type transport system permease protein